MNVTRNKTPLRVLDTPKSTGRNMDVMSIGLLMGNRMIQMKEPFYSGEHNLIISFRVLIKGDSSFNILLR